MKYSHIFTILILFVTLAIISAQEVEVTPEVTEVVVENPVPEPNFSVEGNDVTLDLYFTSVRQGRAGLLGLHGADIERATASVGISTVDFFQLDDRDGWWALIALDMTATVRQTDLTVTVNLQDTDEPEILQTRFNIVNGGFISQPVNLIPDEATMRLLEPEVEANEFVRILGVASTVTDEAYWGENSWIVPSFDAEFTSPFGASRIFNDELQTVHTGWDFNAPTGTPLFATASGRVAFAGALDIRGNYVLVDHGQGVYSGYAHLSVVYVTQGQEISEGQILGLVGSTGRSSSAHAHFEMIVNGVWVDAADFLAMYVP